MSTNRQLKDLAVRIQKDSCNVGSGLLYIPPSGDSVYVLTAAHVLSNFSYGDTIMIQCCSGDGKTYAYELEDPDSYLGKGYRKDRSHDVALIEIPDVPELLESRSRIFFGEPVESLKLEGFCFSGNSNEELVDLDVLSITSNDSLVINYANHMMTVQLKGYFTINQADREQEVEGWSGTVLMAAEQEALIAVGILVSIPGINGLNGLFEAADISHLLTIMDQRKIPYETKKVIIADAEAAPPKQEHPADLSCTVWWTSAQRGAGRFWFDDHSGLSLDSLLLTTEGIGTCFLSSCIEGSFAKTLNALVEQYELPGRWIELRQNEAVEAFSHSENVILTITEVTPHAYARLIGFITKWNQISQGRQMLVHFRCADPYDSIKFSRQAANELARTVPVTLLNAIDPFAFGATSETAFSKASVFLEELAQDTDAQESDYPDLSEELSRFLYDNPECSRAIFENSGKYADLLPAVFSLATSAHGALRTLLDSLGAYGAENFLMSSPWFDVRPDWFLAAWETEMLAENDPGWYPVLEYIQDHMNLEDLDIQYQITHDPNPEFIVGLDPRHLRYWMRKATPDQCTALLRHFSYHLCAGFLSVLFGSGVSPLLLDKIKNPKTRTIYASVLMPTITQQNNENNFELRARILGQ